MSVKNNAVAADFAAKLGLSLGQLGPVVDAMLNDSVVTDAQVVAVDKAGRCMVFATVAVAGGPAEVRVVADSGGNARTYANATAALGAVKAAAPAVVVTYTPFVMHASVGDPIKALIAKHKAAKTEAQKADQSLNKAQTGIVALIAAADALEWDTAAAGTPEAQEWGDLQARKVSVTEWKTRADALVTQYTASLVAAGIDPVTYLAGH